MKITITKEQLSNGLQAVQNVVATRTQWDADVMIFPRVRGVPLDPSIDGRLTTKAGIDCTKPVGKVFAERLRVREDLVEGLSLSEILGEDALQQIPTERM